MSPADDYTHEHETLGGTEDADNHGPDGMEMDIR